MNDLAGLIRAVALLLPAFSAAVLWVAWKPSYRLAIGMLLATIWNLWTLQLLNMAAQHFGWWQFHAKGGLLCGVPVDLLIGWAVLWGMVGGRVAARVPMYGVVGGALLLDLVVMPYGSPVVVLNWDWLVGEAAGIILCLVPGLVLCKWTRKRSHLQGRNTMQLLCFAGIFLVLVPLVALQAMPQPWPKLGTWEWTLAQLMMFPVALGIMAVRELGAHGGTPFPYDPPNSLAAGGPYAYVRNPMQLAQVLLYVGLAGFLHAWVMLVPACVVVIYGAGLARWQEEIVLTERWGREWQSYRCNVRAWLPRWRPYSREQGFLYIAQGCDQCSQLGDWLKSKYPRALQILDAGANPSGCPTRVAYQRGAIHASGVVAVAHAMEHIHLGYAMVGFIMRLPVMRWFLQLVCDAVVAAPRPVRV